MKCRVCGNDYTSQYYFATPDICKECFQKMPPEEQQAHYNMMQVMNYAEKFPFRVGFGRRLGAALIDLLLFYIIFMVLFVAFGLYEQVSSLLDDIMTNPQAIAEMTALVSPLLLIISFIYYSLEIFLAATPGKLILGIQIASEDMTTAPLGKLLIRFVIKRSADVLSLLFLLTSLAAINTLGSIAGLVILIGFFFVLAERRQAFHDMLAKTAVFRRSDVVDSHGQLSSDMNS